MSFNAEAIVDRRRLKRRVTKWRVIAVVAVIVAVAAFGLSTHSQDGVSTFSNHIARVHITGLITGSQKQLDLLNKLAKSDRVKAVLINIDSPGGTTAGSEAIYEEIRKLANVKPVVSVLGAQATSGGYIAALAGDYIVARGNTLTGSIGVIFQWPQVRNLMDKLGIKVREVKSDPLKAAPSPFVEETDEAIAVLRELISDSHEWFLRLVEERRKLGKQITRKLGNGRVYTGRQAFKKKLVDKIGGEDEALAWLRESKKISSDLKVVNWKLDLIDNLSLPGVMAEKLGRIFGISFAEGMFEATKKTLVPDQLKLDGLLFVWQPAT